jgi:hypothetical protein
MQKITKLASSLLFSLFILHSIHGQSIVLEKDAKEVIQNYKKFYVVLPDNSTAATTKEVVKKYDYMLAPYQKYCDNFNASIKESIQAHWHLTSNVEFVSEKEFFKMVKNSDKKERKQKNALVLTFPDLWDNYFNLTKGLKPFEFTKFNPKNPKLENEWINSIYLSRYEDLFVMSIGTLQNKVFNSIADAAASYAVRGWDIKPAEVIFALENMQFLIKKKATMKNGDYFEEDLAMESNNKGKLQNKTLLIPIEYTFNIKKGIKVITEAEIKSLYPWKWRFATWEEINEAIDKKDDTIAILYSTYCRMVYRSFTYRKDPTQGYYYWAVDASDVNSVLSFSDDGATKTALYTKIEKDPCPLSKRRISDLVENAKK